MKKLLHAFMITLILLANQNFVYGARVQSLSKDDSNSSVPSSENSKNDNTENKSDELKDKEKNAPEKSDKKEEEKSDKKEEDRPRKKINENLDKKAEENVEQIKLMSASEFHQKVKSIDWISWLIKAFRILLIIMIARTIWKVLKIAIEKHLNKLLFFIAKIAQTLKTLPYLKQLSLLSNQSHIGHL